MDRIEEIIAHLNSRPCWAMLPSALERMGAALRRRAEGGAIEKPPSRPGMRLFGLEGELVAQVTRSQPMAAVTSGRPAASLIAVIGVYGPIQQRADAFMEMFGGVSTERLSARVKQALADPAVKAIVFDHDSPGGSVYGVEELATEIRGARGRKPMGAVANSLSASASYYLASQADEFSVTPSGEAGSIGVYTLHVDLSKALEAAGWVVTAINYGENKVEGAPWGPLSPEAKDHIQSRVSDYGVMFERAVAKGRGVSVDTVRSTFGQGRVYGAQEAVKRGMADRVETLDGMIRRLGSNRGVLGEPSAQVPAAGAHEREAAAAMLRTL